MSIPRLLTASLAIALFATLVNAEEIEGKITQVEEKTFSISTTSNLLPAKGDKLTVFVEIPGVGKAEVGTALVVDVTETAILATIVRASGRVAAGQLVTIDSPNPTKRAGMKVPAVIGLNAQDAKRVLEAAKLVAKFRVGEAPPKNVRGYTAYLQSPKAEARAAAGSTITVTLYGAAAGSPPAPTSPPSTRPASRTPPPAAPPTSRVRRSDTDWGTPINPSGECTIRQQGDSVTMTSPAGNHNIWYGSPNAEDRYSAPRMLQEVRGDFVAEVKVTADWDANVSEYFFRAGGLLIWDSEDQYLRIERSLMKNRYGESVAFVNPIYDRDGGRLSGTKIAPASFHPGRSSWLRVSRKGKRVSAWLSHDGKSWTPTFSMQPTFPDRVQVGVASVTTTPVEFVAKFEDFSIQRGGSVPSLAASPTIAIPGWGDAIDPDGDCMVMHDSAASKSIRIVTPPSHHDLHFAEKDRAKRFNGPRVLRTVTGDFVMQAKVTSDWQLGEPLPSGRNFIAAGLLVWGSEDEYFRHERNVYISPRQPGKQWSYIPPIYDRDGERISKWKAQSPDYFQGGSTWLRIERRGQQLIASISHDGRRWTQTARQTTKLPRTIQAGLSAISATDRKFATRFDEFSIRQ